MNNKKPFAPSADRNRHAILDVLQTELSTSDHVLEIGSGTGQHICHFAAHMPTVQWQPTDRADKLPGMCQWFDECALPNILRPIELDLNAASTNFTAVNACYSSNTLHIISWPLVETLFALAAQWLADDGKLIVYGPFLFNGEYGSEGNREFDQQLRAGDPKSGIRDVRALDKLAQANGFNIARVNAMPSNNHLLVWDRQSTSAP